MILELFKLIWILITSSPKKTDSLEIVKMNHFPFKGYIAMSWCGKLITRNPDRIDNSTVNHELIHLFQAKQYSCWTMYYLSYFWQWIKGNPFHKSSYFTNPFESEAYANEGNYQYCQNYDKSLRKIKYTFKKRHSLWKSVGGTIYAWKRYIKSL